MYLIDKNLNIISPLTETKFAEHGISERGHLQEWIAKNPVCLDADGLLIIQKEFDGFNNTNERLDLLALDKRGNLVVIENKLDDSGKDVTWQIIKYAAYCSTLNKENICDIFQSYFYKNNVSTNAKDKLAEFYNKDYEDILLNQGQLRLILVAGNFRREVTSAILWLMKYGLIIQCIKVTPYEFQGNLLLDFEQIIPMKDTEEYIIKMADKVQSELAIQEGLKSRHKNRLEFWNRFLLKAKEVNSIFSKVSPSKDSWIGISFHRNSLNVIATQKYARVEYFINSGSKVENELAFDELYKLKQQVELKFGCQLEWDKMSDKIACKIGYSINDVDITNKDTWPSIIDFLISYSKLLCEAINAAMKKEGISV